MAERHFFEQRQHADSYLIPFFRRHLDGFERFKVLEVGCAEGGFLDALHELHIDAMGLELEPSRAQTARRKNPSLDILVGDITDDHAVDGITSRFDLIVMRDVIEHIPDKAAAWRNIRRLLKDGAYLYISFPPRYSPFAGHQQMGRSILRFVPYLQLLPKIAIRLLGKLLRERPKLIEDVILNFQEGLSVRSFRNHCVEFGFGPIIQELFLIRPIYSTRFGLKPRRIPSIPGLREVMAMSCECLLQERG